MKKRLINLSLASLAAFFVMFMYWVAGCEFVRSPALAKAAILASVFFVSVLVMFWIWGELYE